MCAGLHFEAIEDELRSAAEQVGLPDDSALYQPPFLMVASNTYRFINGEPVPVRQYPWGECLASNIDHSDFTLIKWVTAQDSSRTIDHIKQSVVA